MINRFKDRKLATQLDEKSQIHTKLKSNNSLKRRKERLLFSLNLMGLVGWSVIIPTLIGFVVGLYFDKYYPWDYSWTLSLLITGFIVGCINARLWVKKHRSALMADLVSKDSDDV